MFLIQTTGVRCMTFNPDGKTLLCGLQESLKVCFYITFSFCDNGISRRSLAFASFCIMQYFL